MPGTSAAELRDALHDFESACDVGDDRACNVAGNLHRRGIGTVVDLRRALSYYRRACIDDAQTPEACFNEARVAEALAAADLPPD